MTAPWTSAALIAALAVGSATAQAPTTPPPVDGGRPAALFAGPTLGWLTTPQDAEAVAAAVPQDLRGRMVARLTARWGDVERVRGAYDWSAVAPAIDRLHGAGARVTLCLTGSNRLYVPEGGPPTPYVAGSLEGWTAFVRDAVRTFAGRIDVLEIWDDPSGVGSDPAKPPFDPELYAFVLKNASIAARAEAKSAGVRLWIAEGAVGVDELDWQRRLWTHDVAPYIDVLPVHDRPDGGFDPAALTTLLQAALEYPPAPAVWAYLHADASNPSAALQGAVAALTSAATVALVAPPEGEGGGTVLTWLAGVQTELARGYAPAPSEKVTFDDGAGRAVEGASLLAQYFNATDFTTLMICDTSHAAVPEGQDVWMVIPSTFVRGASTIDPVAGRTLRTAARPHAGDDRTREVRLPVLPYPVLLQYQSAAGVPGAPELPPEEIDVRRTRGLTAEEIIARYREVQKVQDDRLERWIATARIDFHFKLAQGTGTVDVSIDSTYFWQRGHDLEWEQTAYYVNGNRVRWKNIPQLPLVQPEKVVTLPLDLTLDKTYTYRKVGEERVDGREAYVLAFDPTDENAARSLYRGRIWIDAETFERLRVSVIQTNLDAPVVSNEERDRYRTVPGPDGFEYRLLDLINGEQVWSVGGRNFVVQREVRFRSYDVNPTEEAFVGRQKAAYASRNQMLRDTDEGFRYLERGPDGTRKVQPKLDTSQWFAAAGAFKDNSTSGVTPLAGASYVNLGLGKHKVQVNALFGGVIGFLNAAKPDLIGKRVSGALDAAVIAIKLDDKVFSAGEELLAERIRTRNQSVAARLGIPVGEFLRFNLVAGASLRQYFESSDARDFRGSEFPSLAFRLPPDHVLYSGAASAEFNRRGFTLSATGTWFRRSKWSEWGLYDTETGEPVQFDPGLGTYVAATPEPLRKSYARWGVTVGQQWFLPAFQKLRLSVDYLNGSRLDRFSRYEFSFFGDDRLNGFSGSGVRFDDGAIARAGYGFNLFKVVQLDLSVETARVRNELDAAGRQSFTGLGFSGNFIGPWKTVINLDYGRALRSDIPELEGNDEFLLVILKLF